MKYTRPNYQSYLLRLWYTDEKQGWRVIIEHIGDDQRHGFADLESFFDFLRCQTEVMQEKNYIED